MLTNRSKVQAVLLGVAAAALAACASLDVENPNAPDRSRALAQPADVSSLLGGAFYNWYFSTQDYAPSVTASTIASHNSMSWGNWGSRFYSSVPRQGFQNVSTDVNSTVQVEPLWYNDYSALVSANLALGQASDPAVFKEGTADTATAKMVKAGAQFIQGVTLGNLALWFNQAFILDETTDPSGIGFSPATAVRDAAIKKLDAAIASSATTFQLPATFLNITGWTNVQLAQVANTEAARILAYFPRSASEAASVDWAKVAAYASKGISVGTKFNPSITGNNDNWYDGWKNVGGDWDTWMRVNQRVVAELDPTQPTTYVSSPRPPAPVSLDQRYDPTPRNDASAGSLATKDFLYVTYDNFNPSRGYYHFSNVGYNRYAYHGLLAADGGGFGIVPFIIAAENDLLWAEALVRQGGAANYVQAAQLINNSRSVRGGLPPLTGAEVGPAGVVGLAPKYNNFTYSTNATAEVLLRAIFYERDIELMMSSALTPFFDARRTNRFDNYSVLAAGDLVKSPHQFPVPAKELSTLAKELYTFKGGDSVSGATSVAPPAVSTLSPRSLGRLNADPGVVGTVGPVRLGGRLVYGPGVVADIAADYRRAIRAMVHPF